MAESRNLATLSEEEIPHHLHGLSEGQFEQLVENPAFRTRHLVTVLRDKNLGTALLRRIAEDEELTGDYRVKACLALHPHTPKVVAMKLLRHLFWRDLVRVIDSLRVHPQVRRNAEHILADQIETLTLGERLTLARIAGRSVIRMLRKETDPKIIRVLLNNTRVTEEDVLFLVQKDRTHPGILQVIGRSPRWAHRYPVRLALVRHPGTPPGVSLSLVSRLNEPDLKGLLHTPTVPHVVRKTAERILKEGRGRP